MHLFETQGVYTIRGREPWPRRIVLNQRDLNRGSSIRQNAFGASIRVTQTARIVTSLALTNPLSGPGFVHHHYPILLDPGIDPRVLKSQLAVVVVCDVSQGDDSAMEYSSSTTPTFTSPVEEVTLYATLKARARGLWIYNSVTGRIYLRIDSL